MLGRMDDVLDRRSQLLIMFRFERRRRLREISALARAGETEVATTALHLAASDATATEFPAPRTRWWSLVSRRLWRSVA